MQYPWWHALLIRVDRQHVQSRCFVWLAGISVKTKYLELCWAVEVWTAAQVIWKRCAGKWMTVYCVVFYRKSSSKPNLSWYRGSPCFTWGSWRMEAVYPTEAEESRPRVLAKQAWTSTCHSQKCLCFSYEEFLINILFCDSSSRWVVMHLVLLHVLKHTESTLGAGASL